MAQTNYDNNFPSKDMYIGSVLIYSTTGVPYIGGVAMTCTAAELNVLDAVTAGIISASKGVVVDASKDVTGFRNVTATGTVQGAAITATGALTGASAAITYTSASTDGGTSVESMVVSSTLTGAGGVGGRARFQLDTNVVLGGWANALKGITVFGASGGVTGLGSAVLSEMTLSAGTSSGTYAPLEIELNLPSGASTGTQTSFIYASVNGDGAGTFDDNGGILSINGITIDTGHVVQASAVSGVNSTHALRVFMNGTAYYVPAHTSASFA